MLAYILSRVVLAKKPSFTRGQGRCIFCGEPGLTKEHIFAEWLHPFLLFAEWLHPFLPKSDELNHYDRTVIIQINRDDVENKLRAGEAHSGRARVVCRKCNNEWMSVLQTEAKPFLLPLVRGERIPLFIRQQSILAAWISMFVMVAEHRDSDRRVIATSPAARRAFMDTRRAPKHWKIWIGHYERHKWVPVVAHSAAEIVSDTHDGMYAPPNRPVAPNTHATTFVVGKLFVHVFGSTMPRVLRKQDVPVSGVSRLWPFWESPIWWPPKVTLTDNDADAIAFAFTNRLKGLRDSRLIEH
ncbi:MAG: hypothetical protein HY834_19255 [Devosia nanyangense]|uniref:Uncharacterized protein n=1 Tax=Devosia nanyangense TaxID=1228055 RepID=A0A933L7M7_9HYPH|nr:hypothetical protein [Devosia nanyangense]